MKQLLSVILLAVLFTGFINAQGKIALGVQAGVAIPLGDFEKALNLYETVVKAKPEEQSYALLLVNLYQRMDRGEDAIVQLELLRRKEVLEDVDKIFLGELHLLGALAQ